MHRINGYLPATDLYSVFSWCVLNNSRLIRCINIVSDLMIRFHWYHFPIKEFLAMIYQVLTSVGNWHWIKFQHPTYCHHRWKFMLWAGSWYVDTYRICEQQRLRWASANVQSHRSLHCSHILNSTVTGLEVIKKSCPTQLSMKFLLLIKQFAEKKRYLFLHKYQMHLSC